MQQAVWIDPVFSSLDRCRNWLRQLPVVRQWPLIKYLVRADLLSTSQNLTLGALWWIAEPLCLCLIYVFLIENVLGRGREDHGFFISTAILPWRWFTSATASSANSLVRKAGIVKSLRTAPCVFPLAQIAYATIMFCWSLPVYGILMLWYQRLPSLHLLWLPVIMVVELCYVTAFSLALAGITVYFRDVHECWSLITRIWFYLSPGLYAIENVPASIRPYYKLNPFSVILPSFRNVLMRGIAPAWQELFYVFLAGLCLLVVSAYVFHLLSRRAPNYL